MLPELAWTTFLMKLVRYCLYMWLPFYLFQNVSISMTALMFFFFLQQFCHFNSDLIPACTMGDLIHRNIIHYLLSARKLHLYLQEEGDLNFLSSRYCISLWKLLYNIYYYKHIFIYIPKTLNDSLRKLNFDQDQSRGITERLHRQHLLGR